MRWERDLRKNRLLFESLRDDEKRAKFYMRRTRIGGKPLLFKTTLRFPGPAPWLSQDVALLTRRDDIEHALKFGSTAPYASLDDGAPFMLGCDAGHDHTVQRNTAIATLKFTDAEIDRAAETAFRRAAILPLKQPEFDLATDMARQVALRYIALLFGFRDEAHPWLDQAMFAAYTKLVFEIVGRHFSSETGLPPRDAEISEEVRDHVREEIRLAANTPVMRDGAPAETVITRVVGLLGWRASAEDTIALLLGLVAGTIGNITAAISIVMADFFGSAGGRQPTIEMARDAGRRGDARTLEAMIWEALLRNPPAPFLTRIVPSGGGLLLPSGVCVPAGTPLVLAIGANPTPDLVFGGAGPGFLHSCVGRHLAWPLILATVRNLLRVPGLAQQVDAATGKALPLKKRWGAICMAYPVQHQRARRMRQQPLHLVLPIKEPIAENSEKLLELMRAGAPVVEEALDNRKHVHSAYFMLEPGDRYLRMMTVYDGDLDAYIEHFAIDVPLFDEQLKYLEGAPPTPTREHPKEFVEWIDKHNHVPFGGYFYSAYPGLTVADIENAVRP
jgi:cytochrome P450